MTLKLIDFKLYADATGILFYFSAIYQQTSKVISPALNIYEEHAPLGISIAPTNLSLSLSLSSYLNSDMCPRSDSQGQDGYLGSLHDGPGGKVEKEDKDGAAGAQPGVEREILLVSEKITCTAHRLIYVITNMLMTLALDAGSRNGMLKLLRTSLKMCAAG